MKTHTFGKRPIQLICSTLLLAAMGTAPVKAQLNPMGASFYQNQYLSNPAMAGTDGGIKLNLHYRNQWSSVPGAPVNYALTGEFALPDKKSSVGVNAYNDKAGLLSRTRVVGTFAYHLPLNGVSETLSFGLSVGFMNERIDDAALNGDISDPGISNFNNKPTYIDGDFGIAYTNKQWNAQASVPNLNSFLNRSKRESADVGTYYASVSYKIFEDEEDYGYNVEPKLAYRGIRSHSDIFDVGAQVSLGGGETKTRGMVVYHSSKSVSAGLGLLMKSRYELNAIYNSPTAALTSYTNGTFEVGLGLRF
ncbi:PorP/SprF family type IX secretion system membrane protein [Pedobacter boryungensis]|uniref:PorP/SprF family type IX secretion system membrane protein n=2 Tax=Pedobacter boryungensis TaxID=869962 RepID=A0ABX2D7P1_9SPHI|nr:PorP/SprF family type IX secretion system membrane protein [Pedobacter boryungensis]